MDVQRSFDDARPRPWGELAQAALPDGLRAIYVSVEHDEGGKPMGARVPAVAPGRLILCHLVNEAREEAGVRFGGRRADVQIVPLSNLQGIRIRKWLRGTPPDITSSGSEVEVSFTELIEGWERILHLPMAGDDYGKRETAQMYVAEFGEALAEELGKA
jgi:hypothetical protein